MCKKNKFGFKKIIKITSVFMLSGMMFISSFSRANDDEDFGWISTNEPLNVEIVEVYNL